jgi:hypothetical protein
VKGRAEDRGRDGKGIVGVVGFMCLCASVILASMVLPFF